jgi:hypothetical protein
MYHNIMVVRTCLHLHNFCIDESIRQGRYDEAGSVEGNNVWHKQSECAVGEGEPTTRNGKVKRTRLAAELHERGYQRPPPKADPLVDHLARDVLVQHRDEFVHAAEEQ